jgi:organic radical activating enzyme
MMRPMSAGDSVPFIRFEVSELFRSLQGEGVFTGAPSYFVRLGRCNLSCSWCDTPYSWDFERYDYGAEVTTLALDELLDRVLVESPGRLVITGGEPLLQQKGLVALFALLDERRSELGAPREFVEIETNGTVPPRPELLERVDHWNVSPKLSSSGEPEERRIRVRALTALRDTGRASLKLVVREDDLAEADALIESLVWPRERVVLMPEASTRAALAERGSFVAAAALARRVRYSSRLHIELFGGKRGV